MYKMCGLLMLGLLLPWAAAAGETVSETANLPLLYGIHPGPESGFWTDAREGANDAAKKLGYRVIYRGAPETDKEAQPQMVEDAFKLGAKGIFVAPNDPARAADVARAKAKGVPVVYFDRTMGDMTNVGSYIATDNYKAGVLAAQILIDNVGQKAGYKVAVLRMDPNIPTTDQREKGFIETVTKAGYVVVAQPYIGSAIEEGRKNVMAFLQTPAAGEAKALFTPNETTAMATLLTLQMLGKTEVYKLVGFDSNPDMEQAIRDGSMLGMVVQQPYRMGYYSIEALNKLLKNQKTEAFIESGAMAVTPSSLNTYKVKMRALQ